MRLNATTPACALLALVAFGCGGNTTGSNTTFELQDIEEPAQAVGDVLASADESSGMDDGSFAVFMPGARGFDGHPVDRVLDALVPDAHAATCWGATSTFGACTNGQVLRDFAGCTIGTATLNGQVRLNWNPTNNCRLDVTGDKVTRVPDFTLTGRRGATLSVSGEGQELTRTGADTYTYRVLGMRRSLVSSAGTTIADIRAVTLTDIGVTGTSRANRVMDGGTLQITHLTRNYVTRLTPVVLAWNGTCTCPVSGALTGTALRDDESRAVSITFTGCGTANVDVDGTITAVTMDRCASL